ncbi:hypothetical protein ACEZCY_15035 [Streptacidiphilus sp. N1-12]|uniref:Transmembrane protein n=2 Tax=Streptacidiphilus alkalitolerans TaxID=3342712 RepID=A0ABV6VA42_9ACTN
MDNAPFLQAEDKLDYARILEELLHNEQVRAALRRAPTGPNVEQLHTRAMTAYAEVSATAAAEYSYFVQLRDQARQTAIVPAWDRIGGDEPTQWQAPESAFTAAERAGWVPLIAVLLPILSGLSGLVLLLFGWALLADHSSSGHPMISAGLVALVICTASICGDIIGLLLTANRDGHTPPDGRNPELYAELAKARETWHGALRERGLLPYLLAQLGTVPRPPGPRPAGVSLVRARPRLGFSSPGFTSPGSERISDRDGEEVEQQEGEIHFSSPGFTSPGPERITDERGHEIAPSEDDEPHFSSPRFTSPTFQVPRQDPDVLSPHVPPPVVAPPVPGPRPSSRFLRNDDDEDADVNGGRR